MFGIDNPKRPVKRSENLYKIRGEISKFVNENVTFIAEVPSIVAKMCFHENKDYVHNVYHFQH